MLREARVQQRLEPAVVLHPLGQRVADDADVVVLRSSNGAAACPPRRDVSASASDADASATQPTRRIVIMQSVSVSVDGSDRRPRLYFDS